MFTVRLVELVDSYVESTVKFVYVHWVGESVPFTKKGKFGVVHGSVEEHFQVREELQQLVKLITFAETIKSWPPADYTSYHNFTLYNIHV